MQSELQEVQRYGRNKNTTVNHSYINSGEYRNKFDRISNDKALNRKVYQLTKRMLEHRSGTLFEDMYWLDIDTLEVIASETEQKSESRIKYSRATKKAIAENENLLVIHTHPNSMPPSINDFNSALKNKYRLCIVCCHDGKIFMYHSKKHVVELLNRGTIAKYKKMGYGDYESQILALKELQNNGEISFKEV
ncbi:MAG: hypothetical protein U0L59_01585 [Faecalimonas sp.]|nr:hypothetical protein [Faecalimonas sp.]